MFTEHHFHSTSIHCASANIFNRPTALTKKLLFRYSASNPTIICAIYTLFAINIDEESTSAASFVQCLLFQTTLNVKSQSFPGRKKYSQASVAT